MKEQSRLCQDLLSGMGSLFTCSPNGDYVRIRTPYLYPDGDNIDLYCRYEDDVLTVCDLAETTGWLRSQSAASRRTNRQRQLIQDACITHGTEFLRGMLLAKCDNRDQLPHVVTRVAQAAFRVSDLWFTSTAHRRSTTQQRKYQPIAEQVAEFLTKREFTVDRPGKLKGNSGNEWIIDFHVRYEKRGSLVQVLGAANQAKAHEIALRTLAAWRDLRSVNNGTGRRNFVSLFDDTVDVWTDKDIELVKLESMVSRWSQRDDFATTVCDGLNGMTDFDLPRPSTQIALQKL